MELYTAHRQWAARPADERFATLDELHIAVQSRKRTSDETGLLDSRSLSAVPVGDKLTLAHDLLQTPAELTHWSARQVFSRLDAPADFVAKLTPNTAATVINERIQLGDRFAANLLLATDDNGPVARAFNGERYTRLWDESIVSVLRNRLPSGWRNPVAYEGGTWGAPLVPSGLYASDRDMFAFLISGGDMLDMGGADQLHRGIMVWNSEVGSKTFGWSSFWFRMVCGNNIVWDAQDVHTISARHTKHVHSILDSFELFLLKLAESADKDSIAKAVTAAKSRLVISPTEPDANLINRFKPTFTSSETLNARNRMLAEELSPSGSAWDWLQGFTATARSLPYLDARTNLERRASAALLK